MANIKEPKDESICCFCGAPLKEWYEGSEYYGNNPDPANTIPGKRCCDACNLNIVVPARIYIAELIRKAKA